MHSRLLFIISVLSLALLGAGCSKSTESIKNADIEKPSAIAEKKLRRYDIKEATVNYDVSGTISGTEKLSIRNYGLQEARETHTSITIAGFTQNTDSLVLTDGVEITNIDLNTLTATTIQNPLYDEILKHSQKDLQEVGEEFMKNMNAKKIGTETIAGKDCDIWTVSDLASEVCVWKGIPLRSSSNVGGITHLQVATSISESVDNDAFTMPDGVTVKELPVDLGNLLKDL